MSQHVAHEVVNFDQRRRPDVLRTAIATAFFSHGGNTGLSKSLIRCDSGRPVLGEGGLLEGFSTLRRRWPLRKFYILKVSGHTFETGSRLPLVAIKSNHWLNAISCTKPRL